MVWTKTSPSSKQFSLEKHYIVTNTFIFTLDFNFARVRLFIDNDKRENSTNKTQSSLSP
jgi:hypothetical protein